MVYKNIRTKRIYDEELGDEDLKITPGIKFADLPARYFTSEEKSDWKRLGEKFVCIACGHIYDEMIGDEKTEIPPLTLFDELPDDWVCPVCGAGKDSYILISDL